ncbi:hypothetical protein K2173_007113 [Erythroxylum novogranatense]|uniref:Patellin-3 n=1 Tax=Erythroxylum novogranatense TaxID=1862640 RepID=A0AAV8SZL7_9ROSI|nr:hypothetical protein K2173_007113 [Erythroxylum novogranatense]
MMSEASAPPPPQPQRPETQTEDSPPPPPPPPAAAEPKLPQGSPLEPVGNESAVDVSLTEEKLPSPTPPLSQESKSLAAMMEKEGSSPSAAEEGESGGKSKEEVVVAENTAKEEGEEKKKVAKEEGEEKKKVPQTLESFKEESNKVSDLSDSERKALEELKNLVEEALNTHQFTSSPPREEKKQQSEEPKADAAQSKEDEPRVPKIQSLPDEVSLWSVPLLKDDRTDVILLKFLRARDFKVKDAFTMFKNTIQWRKEFHIDELVDEDLGDDLDKVVFMHGQDRDGHPVCYNVYGEFQNKELYTKTFSDEEKRMKFLRWRIQFLERSIRKLDFNPGGISTIFQVNDLKNSPGPGKRELRLATRQGLQLLQDNYPEFVAKQVFVNVPWWYLAFYTMMSPFMTQRTKSKFVFASPSRSAETLFKYISPEQVPIQYGGLSVDYCDCNPEFTVNDPATEINVKPATKQTVEIIIYETCTIVWELRVVGWEVSYGAEFVPDNKDAYTVIIQKPSKLLPNSEPVVSNSFKVTELGKLLLTIDNPTSKKKKLLYRFKIKPLSD